TRARTSWPRRTASGPSGSSARATSVRASALEMSVRRRRRYRRRAWDSGSRTASFTRAEESRYVALSALIAAEAREHARRQLLAGRERQRIGQIIEVVPAGDEIAHCPEPLDWTLIRQRCENRYRAAPIRHLDGLSGFDAS